MIGLGYKFLKGEGMTFSARYYYGFVDVDKLTPDSQINKSWFIDLSIPIWKSKSELSSYDSGR